MAQYVCTCGFVASTPDGLAQHNKRNQMGAPDFECGLEVCKQCGHQMRHHAICGTCSACPLGEGCAD